ncbi:hypothetical protein EDD22DRAFT_845377 [Suillus occidentalis]|nr:hypothetical protein EDD22DRAFT_845377 [Suillus occidentalis]
MSQSQQQLKLYEYKATQLHQLFFKVLQYLLSLLLFLFFFYHFVLIDKLFPLLNRKMTGWLRVTNTTPVFWAVLVAMSKLLTVSTNEIVVVCFDGEFFRGGEDQGFFLKDLGGDADELIQSHLFPLHFAAKELVAGGFLVVMRGVVEGGIDLEASDRGELVMRMYSLRW